MIVEGALFEARVGSEDTARRIFKFLKSNVNWYGPIYTEASKFEEVRGRFDLAARAVRDGLAACPRYGPLWLASVKVQQRQALVAVGAAPLALPAALSEMADNAGLARAWGSVEDALPLLAHGCANGSSHSAEEDGNSVDADCGASDSEGEDDGECDTGVMSRPRVASAAYTAGYLSHLFQRAHLTALSAPPLCRHDKTWADSLRVTPRYPPSSSSSSSSSSTGITANSSAFIPSGYMAGGGYPVAHPAAHGHFYGNVYHPAVHSHMAHGGAYGHFAPHGHPGAMHGHVAHGQYGGMGGAAMASSQLPTAAAPFHPAGSAAAAAVANASNSTASSSSSSANDGSQAQSQQQQPETDDSTPCPLPATSATLALFALASSESSNSNAGSWSSSSNSAAVSASAAAATEAFAPVYGALSQAASAVNQELLWRVQVEEAWTAAWQHDYPRARAVLARCVRECAQSLRWRVWVAGARVEARAAVWALWQAEAQLRSAVRSGVRDANSAELGLRLRVAGINTGAMSDNDSECDSDSAPTPGPSPLSCAAAPFVPRSVSASSSMNSLNSNNGATATAGSDNASKNDVMLGWNTDEAYEALNVVEMTVTTAAERIRVARALAQRYEENVQQQQVLHSLSLTVYDTFSCH